jgi:uncharacterized membrane protein
LFKSLIGAAVIAADVFALMARKEAFKRLHAEPNAQPHLLGAYALYVVLAILTLWVIASVAQTMAAGSGRNKPAARPGYRYGASQGRGR